MKRRDFIKLVGGAVAAWPAAARAQQPRPLPVIGWLSPGSLGASAAGLAAFRQGLREQGFVDGQNVAIEYHFADYQYDRLPALAADLVRRQVSVIAATGGGGSGLAAKAATTSIPIVFNSGADPVGEGLVTSLNRPGGNLTGVVQLALELGPKRLELLHQLLPAATVLAALLNPANRTIESLTAELQAAARSLGLKLQVLHASTDRDLDAAFASLQQSQAGGLLIGPDQFLFSRNEQIAALALRHAVPTMYQWREFTTAGGLMSYGASQTDVYRLVGSYTGRVLKGDKPADLPVQQSTKIEMIINLRTARALDLKVPQSLLVAADEVIE
jgi:putative tryptophan/tyrosine transport system substrate-binding protein